MSKSRYANIISHVFHEKHTSGCTKVSFERQDMVHACSHLGYDAIKNIGDIPYSFRFRTDLPETIKRTAPAGCEWIIVGTGQASYQFQLARSAKIEPNLHMAKIPIPDATPEIVKMYAPGTDEQALLTRLRYNRIIDIFTGLTCYSIQNHLRTTVMTVGQIEIDELYVGLDKKGTHFMIPCQAKSPGDKFGIVQVLQDIALCKDRYPQVDCKPIAAQFFDENSFAVLEFEIENEDEMLSLKIVEEKHYRLVP